MVTVIVLVAPPPGAAYNFIVNLYTYPGSWTNAAVAGGLVYLRYNKAENWSSPWRAHVSVMVIYVLLNVFLAVTLFISLSSDWNAHGYPYYAFPIAVEGVLVLGVVYWAVWARLWPWLGGYAIVAQRVVSEDGVEMVRYRRVSAHKAAVS